MKIILVLFIFWYVFIWERERESVSGAGAEEEGEGEGEGEAQADSPLSTEPKVGSKWGWISPPWDRDLSRNQESDAQLRGPEMYPRLQDVTTDPKMLAIKLGHAL